ncbi:MAG TPA: DUF2127 domain-containing protein [Thermoanaerobaculia bacterium]|nr:DUF2127 domain-containing protein [Thermoanaerobaculia bacterium]
MSRRRDAVLTLIAIFKIVKALLLVAGGIVALRLLHPSEANRVWRWIADVPFEGERRLFIRLLTAVATKSYSAMAVGAFAYAALFFTEGIGLFLRKRWAEWLTIVATASLIPIQMYELLHRVTATKMAVLAINIAVVIYLIARLRRH